ncbi:Putative protein disulfide-isomerase, PDIA-2 Endoplasmic reticulum lumen [Chondrus crispus]|uniref:Thioredoxin domain-containing protein n=1 Tax=Chondrus crispus TaxID=2769 RepID=R7QAS3_CHOCR|nr:Putative protein disulfide-isomerase, PDIA-2 Endoplasmic reticulum lumen [Chondrus crispus]CDF34893.1 Putative protein disulfide-isomerase, PDIA-2 Endoplasmic reticulum lumen [Chondrus crispus]|eukprot:XP_005714712.1 Putative protein disulfide-isomerase, PDIA-2 Endoplasmic reticulum lumen [Chondrus crispus]
MKTLSHGRVLKALTLLLIVASSATVGLAGMYGEHVVELTASNFDKMVMQSTETWLVKFYAPWCGHCQSSAPAFTKAAKKLDGVAKLGVINCDDHSSLAQRFGVKGFPTLKIFKGDGSAARRPSDYNAGRSAKAFVDQVKYVMPSFVARVKPSGLDAFFKDDHRLPHVLLFTDKSSTSPLYKGMSARFKGRVAFGEVRKTDAADLVKKYSVKSYPALISFKAGESDPEHASLFSGAMDPTSLHNFFESVVGNKDIPPGEPAAEKEPAEKVFAQPKAYSGDVSIISGTKAYEEQCGSRNDGRMCGLALVPGGRTHTLFGDLKPIAEQYQYDNMAFAILDSTIDGGRDFASLFGISSDVGGFIVMRARKKKYAALEAEDGPSKSAISSFLDRIVGGDGRFKKLSSELPKWEVKEPEKEGAGDSNETDNGASEPKDESNESSGQCGTEPPKDGKSCGDPKEEL